MLRQAFTLVVYKYNEAFRVVSRDDRPAIKIQKFVADLGVNGRRWPTTPSRNAWASAVASTRRWRCCRR